MRDLYIGTRIVALCEGARLLQRAALEPADDGVAVAARWLQDDGRRRRLRVWLSGGLCRPLLLPAAGLRNAAERDAAGLALAQRALGAEGACRLWLEPGGHGATAGAAAQEAVVAAIEVAAAAAGTRIVGIAPWWSAALRRVVRQADAGARLLAVHDCDALTLLGGSGRDFQLVKTVAPVHTAAAAASALGRALQASDVDWGTVVEVRLALDAGPAAAAPWADVPWGAWVQVR